ncbi:MAG: hypothetical protein WCB68_18145 [Pyrinomonadaceae bacterium]
MSSTQKETGAKRRSNPKRVVKRNARSTATQEDRRDLRDARRAIEEAKQKGTVSWEEMKQELDL